MTTDLSAILNPVRIDTGRSLSDTVHLALREAITDGQFTPGTRLREVAIANALKVSPTPVREALRRLEREGLVETTSHRGATVADVSPTVMANLYDLHETLEAHAVRRAAERSPHDLAPVRKLLKQLDKSIELPNQTTFNRLDLRFHRALNELSGNTQLAELIEQTHRRVQAARARFDIHLPDRPRRSQAQHHEMLDAVARGDADRAEQLARQHITSIRDTVLLMLEEVPTTKPVTASE